MARRSDVVSRLKNLEAAVRPITEFLSNEENVKLLKQDKTQNQAFLQKEFNIGGRGWSFCGPACPLPCPLARPAGRWLKGAGPGEGPGRPAQGQASTLSVAPRALLPLSQGRAFRRAP